MPIVNLDEVKPGMTLAEAVRNHQDQLLLDAGRRITEKSLRIFKSWGIRRVAVKPGPDVGATGDDGGSPRLPEAIDQELRKRFADVLTDPLMAAIMQAAAHQLALRQPKKKSAHGRR
jgi:molybdopterin biosynthesis enzyme